MATKNEVKYYVAKRTAAAAHRVKEKHPEYSAKQVAKVLGVCEATASVALNHYYPTGTPHEDYYKDGFSPITKEAERTSEDAALTAAICDRLVSIDDKLGRIEALFAELMAPTVVK